MLFRSLSQKTKTRRCVLTLVGVTLFLCAACDSGGNSDAPDVVGFASGFANADASDSLVTEALFNETVNTFKNSENVGYVTKSGVNQDGNAVAFVGLLNADDLSLQTFQGEASFTGVSRAIVVERPSFVTFNTSYTEAVTTTRTAPVTLTANLNTATFSGKNGPASTSSTDQHFDHEFKGFIKDGKLEGAGVTYVHPLQVVTIPRTSTIKGQMSDNSAVLIFEASDIPDGRGGTSAVAGGMILARE